MKKTRFYSLIAIILMFAVALTCGFLFACGSDEEEDTPEEPDTGVVVPGDDGESENDEDVIYVKIYSEAASFDGSEVEYKNGYELTITESVDENGKTVYAISGTATMMSEDQATTFGGGATTADAFIVYEIYAPAGYIIVCGEKKTVVDDTGSETYIQGMRVGGSGSMSFAVYANEDDDEPVAEFTISLTGVSFPETGEE
ncbi:MAG: hypothetical protein LUD72_12140 [Bacteroidales bacterium]|nr:hypothetical protein [Bacteroidales bacterium]